MDPNTTETDLVHCIYTSAGTRNFKNDEIITILRKARINNAKLNVTGILLYDSGSFFQIIEGKQNTIAELYEKISQDERHAHVTKVIIEPIEERSFSEWTMGYPQITREELMKINGLNDFFSSGKCYKDLDKSRATKLLEAFKKGRWRS
jgi:uncharacterized Fe-S cluster-containing MiaB family protein